MGPRPTHLNLSNRAQHGEFQPPRFPNHQYMDLPSPRAGEVPPALSPLDAFALHSRMLARKFEQQSQNGKRLSRLPHDDVAKELANRPDYFRSTGSEGDMSDVPEASEDEEQGYKRDITEGAKGMDRPMSHYPQLGRISRESHYRDSSTGMHSTFSKQTDQITEEPDEYFDLPRAASPEPVDPGVVNVEAPPPNVPSLSNSIDSVQTPGHPRTLTNGSTRSQRSEGGLLLPKSPAVSRSPARSVRSIRSVPPDSDNEETTSGYGSQAISSSRTLSGGSGARSRPASPSYSPFVHPVQRSPSVTSDSSFNGSLAQLPRPAFNFSRPLSSHSNNLSLDFRPSADSRPSFENRPFPERQSSENSVHSTNTFHTSTSGTRSRQPSGHDTGTPFATPGEFQTPGGGDYFSGLAAPSNPSAVVTTPSATKIVLPRGRPMERTSAEQRASWINRQFNWDGPLVETPKPQDTPVLAPTVPKITPRAPSPSPSERIQHMAEKQIEKQTETRERLGRERAFSSANRSRSADPRASSRPPALPSKHSASPSIMTDSTDRTIRATPLHQRAASAELTAEEHLDIGIQAHSSGALSKSTYHLRLAAKAGLPTAMLLYALACRHGWGMRPSQEDGVMWLRKAIDSSSLSVADVESSFTTAARREGRHDPVADAAEKKKRKAQFALGVYELGISYMNGWGCQKDKPLAVRCYEIAGSWGDGDALAEAGFCYTQGIGCKKDLKRAAGLYRLAAEGGMSMAGNSWIYKPKYMIDTTPEKEKKRSDTVMSSTDLRREEPKSATRSRARSIWGRKKDKA